MQRRLALSAVVLSAVSATGCASRAPRPPREPVDIKSLGMLPVKEWEPTGSTAPFSLALLAPTGSTSTPPPISPTLLGMAIGNSIRAGKASERRNLAVALSELDFAARDILANQILQLMEQRSLPVAPINDSALASSIWDDTYKTLPLSHDAVLDIQIHSAGYYPARKFGYVPYLSVSTRLLEPKAPREPIESFGYEINYGDAKGDPRFFSSPQTLMVAELAAFKRDAPAIKHQLTELYKLVAAQLVGDVERVVRKQPRVG